MSNEVIKPKRLFIPATNRGGSGKSTCMMLVANHLKSSGEDIAAIDCDNGNWGKKSSFENFFTGKNVRRLDIRRQRDLDAIVEMTAGFKGDAVICDLPANASASMSSWFAEVLTPSVIQDIGIELVCIGPVAPVSGSVDSVLDWLEVIGERGKFVVMLNRLRHEYAPRVAQEAFKEWFSAGLSNPVVEVGNLDSESMNDLVNAQVLPSGLNGELRYLSRVRIQSWVSRVNSQLASVL